MNLRMDIAKKLRLFRESKGLSQGDIERRSGLLRSYISRVEGGYTAPSVSTLEKFAKALGVEPYQFLYEGQGRPKLPRLPHHAVVPKAVKRLVKLYEGMSSGHRKLLLAVANKLAKA